MKFIVSSGDLLHNLNIVGRAISNKSPLHILENFLFEVRERTLHLIASDNHVTLKTAIPLESVEDEGSVAIPADMILDTLKACPEQPITIQVDEKFKVTILTQTGKGEIGGFDPSEFPTIPTLSENAREYKLPGHTMASAIRQTIFAVATETMRPIMTGLCFDFKTNELCVVGSDAHFLVKMSYANIRTESPVSFILPQKSAQLIKNTLKEDEEIEIRFDEKHFAVQLGSYTVVSILIDGKYPDYEAVIPKDNKETILLNREDLIRALQFVSTYGDKGSNLIKFSTTNSQLKIEANDDNLLTNAVQSIPCVHPGEPFSIGLKSTSVRDILNSLRSEDVKFEWNGDGAPCLIKPSTEEHDNGEIVGLVMPLML